MVDMRYRMVDVDRPVETKKCLCGGGKYVCPSTNLVDICRFLPAKLTSRFLLLNHGGGSRQSAGSTLHPLQYHLRKQVIGTQKLCHRSFSQAIPALARRPSPNSSAPAPSNTHPNQYLTSSTFANAHPVPIKPRQNVIPIRTWRKLHVLH